MAFIFWGRLSRTWSTPGWADTLSTARVSYFGYCITGREKERERKKEENEEGVAGKNWVGDRDHD